MNNISFSPANKIFKIELISLIVHDTFCSTCYKICVSIEQLYLSLDLLCMPKIVMILDSDILSFGSIEELVESTVGTFIF